MKSRLLILILTVITAATLAPSAIEPTTAQSARSNQPPRPAQTATALRANATQSETGTGESNGTEAGEISEAKYALVDGEATFFRDDGGSKRPLFDLPKGYFVLLTGERETTGDGETYLAATYLDVGGYVLENSVAAVDYKPRYKYAESNVLTIVGDGRAVNLRSSPDHLADNVIGEVADRAEIYYYGTTSGSAQVTALGNEWFYVRTAPHGKRGYVYSLYADAQPIAANVIEREPEESPATEIEQTTEPADFSAREEIIVIVALCIPAVVIAFLLFSNPTDARSRRP